MTFGQKTLYYKTDRKSIFTLKYMQKSQFIAIKRCLTFKKKYALNKKEG